MPTLLEHSVNSLWIPSKQETPLFNLVSFTDGSWEGRRVFDHINFLPKTKQRKVNLKPNPRYDTQYASNIFPPIMHKFRYFNLCSFFYRSPSTVKKHCPHFRFTETSKKSFPISKQHPTPRSHHLVLWSRFPCSGDQRNSLRLLNGWTTFLFIKRPAPKATNM